MAASAADGPVAGVRVVFDDFELNTARRKLMRQGKEVRIGGRALDILIALIERPAEILSNQELMARVWPGVHVGDSSLRVHLTELRKVLDEQATGRTYIKNVAGRGYAFVGEIAKLDRPGGHLSQQLYGRDAVIAELTETLVPGRVVVVVAIGGMGKTTVARETVSLLQGRFSGVIWTDMSTAAGRDGAVAQIAAALDVTVASRDPLLEIADALAGRNALLVLDCCEPATRAIREIVDLLMQKAPGVTILATSREIIGARGEIILELPPLAMPTTGEGLSASAATEYAALKMFEKRAAEAGGFVLTDVNAPAVARICSGLDGIPLAIEIVAAQMSTFGILDLEEAVSARLRLAPNPRPRIEPRHATLTDMLAWSYGLLSHREQTLLERLSVFDGVASLDAIRSVVPDGELPESDILVDLTSLGRKSLLKVERLGDRNGFRLLDTTRAFATERLVERGQQQAVRSRHARYMLAAASSLSKIEGDSPLAVQWFGPQTPNLTNLRSALAWSLASDADDTLTVALVSAAVPLAMQLSLLADSEKWAIAGLERIARSAGGRFDAERVRLLAQLGAAMLGSRGPVDASASAMEDALTAANQLGDDNSARLARSGLFWLYIYRGQPADATAIAHQLKSPDQSTADPSADLIAENNIASASTYLGDHDASMRLLNGMERRQPKVEIGKFIRVGSDPGIFSRVFMVKTLWMLGRVDEAARLYERILPGLKAPHHGLYYCYCLNEVMIPILCQQRRWDEARATASELAEAALRQSMAIRRSAGESAAMAIDILASGGDIVVYSASLKHLKSARMHSQMPWFDWVLAVGLLNAGRHGEALDILDAAIGNARRTHNMWWTPELLRTKGEVIEKLTPGNAESGAAIREARAMARQQSALLLEIRAATTYLASRRADDETIEARGWLRGALDRVSEGLDAPDLRAARALLSSGALNSELNDR